MEKAFEFIRNLRSAFIELFGYPIIEFHSHYCEVKFTTSNTIRSFDFLLECPADEFRMFGSSDSSIIIVFTFEY